MNKKLLIFSTIVMSMIFLNVFAFVYLNVIGGKTEIKTNSTLMLEVFDRDISNHRIIFMVLNVEGDPIREYDYLLIDVKGKRVLDVDHEYNDNNENQILDHGDMLIFTVLEKGYYIVVIGNDNDLFFKSVSTRF